MSPEVIGAMVLALESIIGFIFLEPEISKNRMRLFGRRVLHFVRPWFRNKHSVGIILTLWTAGLSIGMASYSSAIPKDFFDISYALLLAAIVWSVGSFWSSSFLVNKRVETDNRAEYKAWVVIVPVLVLTFAVFCVLKIHSIQIARDLSELNGVLIPANDADPPSPCSAELVSESPLRLYFGHMSVVTRFEKAALITLPEPKGDEDYDPILLGIERAEDGSIALRANVVDRDRKVIVRIDRNHFEINRNLILDSLSPPRPDSSTILIKDEYGNVLKIRLLNKNSVFFEGKLYFRPGEYVQIDKNGFAIPTRDIHFRNSICFTFTRSNQSVLEVQ